VGPADSGPECGTTPALHQEVEAGVYCPFTAAGAVHCAVGTQCCETPVGVGASSTCVPNGTGCPVVGSIAWGCDGPLDCAGSGGVCCASGSVVVDPTCGYRRGMGIQSSHCATSCATNEMVICDGPGECGGSKVCTPFKVAGVVLGTCL
jgi:hypothetical protein